VHRRRRNNVSRIALALIALIVTGCGGASPTPDAGSSPKESPTVKSSSAPTLDVSRLDLLKGLERRVLGNGMTVLVKEDHRLPIATVVTSYRVGSVHEVEGATGLAHFLEHMLFKGTRTLKKGEIDAITFEAGGMNNAYTTNDYTAYWFTVHAESFDRFLEIEADRMRNCLLDRSEWESELKVVIEELNRSLDRPWGRLYHEIEPAVFKNSSYHHPVIGFRKDLENMKYEDMVKFYQDHYGPNNATMVVFGDVKKDAVFARVQDLFGRIPPVKEAVPPKMPEPPAEKEARLEFETDKSLHRLGVAYRSDRVGTPTDIRLDVLSQILATGKDSRLYKKLVDGNGPCSEVSTANDSRRHDGVYFVFAELREKRDPGEVEKTILEELERLKKEPVSSREIQKAKNIISSNFVYSKERQYSLADDIARFEAFGVPEYLKEYLARIHAVTAAELQESARALFTKENRTAAVARAKARRTPPAPSVSGSSAEFGEYYEYRLSNGLTILVKPKRDLPIVSMQAYVDAGQGSEPEEKAGVSTLLGMLLDQGVAPPGGTARSAEDIAVLVDFTGTQLSTTATGVAIKTLTPHEQAMYDLLRDLLLYPTLPAEKVADKKDLQLSELRGRSDAPEIVARDLFNEAVYEGHPMHRPDQGYAKTVELLTRADVAAHHRRCFRPDNTIIAVAGDVNPQSVLRDLRKRFLEWAAPGPTDLAALPAVVRQRRPKRVVESRETNQINYVVGHLSVDRNHPDYFALRVLEHVFCRSTGFADRLSKTVRDDAGMAYEVWGILTQGADRWPGPFMIYIGTAAENGAKPLDMTLKIIDDLQGEGPTDAEIARAKNYLLRSLPFAWEATDQLAQYMITLRRLNLGIDYPARYVRAIRAVTKDDLLRVAREHLNSSALTTVIVGPVDKEGNVK
jgi:zinc protease